LACSVSLIFCILSTCFDLLMSFRDTFTRSSSSENLQYDDTASLHFLATVMSILSVALLYNIGKKALFPWGNVRGLKEAGKNSVMKAKVERFKKERRYSFLTFWWLLKLVALVLMACYLVRVVGELREADKSLKGFDPYDILGID
jgi:preprotein translocase subunit Sec63